MVESRRVQSGFSLMELMIAVAIVAILASIAYPSYVGYIQQARRADAVASLMELAQFMERYYTRTTAIVRVTGVRLCSLLPRHLRVARPSSTI